MTLIPVFQLQSAALRMVTSWYRPQPVWLELANIWFNPSFTVLACSEAISHLILVMIRGLVYSGGMGQLG